MAKQYVRELEAECEVWTASLDSSEVVGRVIHGRATLPVYVSFLTGTFHYVRWSGYLLAKTALGLRNSAAFPALVEAIEGKAAEEGAHDRLLLRDLQRLGQNPELIKGMTAPSAVNAYVAYSLALAEAGSPGFLGAAYVLEYISARRATIAARELRRGKLIPNIEQALSFLDTHGRADAGHIAELSHLLGGIDEPSAERDILASARLVQRLYPCFFPARAGGE